jgi:hypothetical protein
VSKKPKKVLVQNRISAKYRIKRVFEWRSANTISKAPDSTGNTNRSIAAVMSRDQGNNGSVFRVKEYDLKLRIVT